MGKPSIPKAPAAPTPAQISDANVQTAEHMAKLSRAMEFGEELMRDVRSEDGSRVKYEKVKTDVPTGYEPQYSNQAVNTSGPSDFTSDPFAAKVDSNGKLSGFTYTARGRKAVPLTAAVDSAGLLALKGKSWASDEVQGLLKGKGWEKGFSGSQPLTSQVKTLTGYKNASGDVITANQYYKTSYDSNGKAVGGRELVDRDEAVDVDFAGMGDIDRAIQRWEFEKETSSEVADHLLAQARKYGLGEGLENEAGFVKTAVDMIKLTDETGYAVREQLGKMVADAADGKVAELPGLDKLATLLGPEAVKRLQGTVPALQQINITEALGLPGEYAAVGEFGAADEVLGRLGKAPTTEELARGAAPKFGEIGAMGDLRGAPTAPGFGEFEGDLPGLERAKGMAGLGDVGGYKDLQEMQAGPGFVGPEGMGTLGRRGAAPTLGELEGGPALEKAGELEKLERLGAFGGLERAGEMGDLEEVEKMAALERIGKGAVPDLERLEIEELALDPEVLARKRYAEERLAERAQDPETSRLMAEEARRIARGRAAATGNIFGGGAVIEEARAVRLAEEGERGRAREEYLRFQQSGQTAADYEAQVSAENLRRRAMGIGQRGAAAQAEYGMGMQRLSADNQAVLQERAQRLGGIAQRNEAEEREYRAALQTLESNRQAQVQEYGLESERVGQQNEARLREQAGRLESIASRTSAQQAEYENLQAQLNQINAAKQAQFGMGGEALMADQQAQLQERADELSVMDRLTENQQREYQNLQTQIAHINETRQAQFGMQAQKFGIDQQSRLAERGAYMEGVGQRVGAQQAEVGLEMGRLDQQQRAREAGFQASIQAAGFDNENTLRKRVDELGAQKQRTEQDQAQFDNLAKIVSQINQARGGQFGMQAQQLEINTQQQMRERADELASAAQRNQAQEAEYQDLLAGLSQKERATQAQFGMQQSQLEGQQAYGQRQDQQRQQAFSGAMQKTMSEEQLKQQQMANLQSFSGLAPVAGQFGMMPGAQQAAASTFTPVGYQPTNAMELLQGQQQMAASNFGTQENIFGTQAKAAVQPSGFGQVLGTVGGAAMGGWANTW